MGTYISYESCLKYAVHTKWLISILFIFKVSHVSLFTVFHRTKSSGDQKIHMHLVVAYWVITKWLKFSKSIEGNKFLENNFYFIGGAFRYLRIFSHFMETIPFWILIEKLSSKECFGTIFLTISEMTIAVDQIWVIAEFLHFSQ